MASSSTNDHPHSHRARLAYGAGGHRFISAEVDGYSSTFAIRRHQSMRRGSVIQRTQTTVSLRRSVLAFSDVTRNLGSVSPRLFPFFTPVMQLTCGILWCWRRFSFANCIRRVNVFNFVKQIAVLRWTINRHTNEQSNETHEVNY